MRFFRHAARACALLLLLVGIAAAQEVAMADFSPNAVSNVDLAQINPSQNRVALVLGNSQYTFTTPLSNPHNDAWAITEALQRMDFDVLLEMDLDKSSTEQALKHFAQKLKTADVALFYYAGHGLQVDGVNYLVPIDADLQDETDLLLEVIEMNTVLRIMESKPRVNLIFLDACRNNPLAYNLARSMGAMRSASVKQGLASMDAATGTLISFATKDDYVAMDGDGEHSPYARALLKHIDTPGVDVALMLRRVREDVMNSTGDKQVPWEYGSLLGEFCFVDAPVAVNPLIEIEFWRSAKEADNLDAYQAYLKKYPKGEFKLLAYERITNLGGEALLAANKDVNQQELSRLVAVVAKDGPNFTVPADLLPGQTAVLPPSLRPEPEDSPALIAEARQDSSTVTVAANVAGASVYMKERSLLGFETWFYKGQTPYSLEGLEPGEYEFRLKKPGYADIKEIVVVEPGAEHRVELALQEARPTSGGFEGTAGFGAGANDSGSADPGGGGGGGGGYAR